MNRFPLAQSMWVGLLGMLRRLLLVAALFVAPTGCGSDSEPREASDLPEGRIVVTTDEGSVVEFTDFEVSCPNDAKDEWVQDARVVQAVAGAYGTASHRRQDGMFLTAGDGVEGRFSLPYSEEWGNYDTFVLAFASRAAEARELSSAVEETSGTIEIVAASCDPTPSLEVKIDGKFASEIGVGMATVKGHIKVD